MTPQWTREAPKVAGWYWMRRIYGHGPGTLEIVEAVGFCVGDGIAHFTLSGQEDPWDLGELPGIEAMYVEWSGPLPPPDGGA